MRNMTSFDYSELSQLNKALSVQKLKTLLSSKTKNYGVVIEKANNIVAYCIYEESDSISILDLFVDPHFRRNGYGTELINGLIEKKLRDDMNCICVTVKDSALQTHIFLKSLDFRAKINERDCELYDFTLCPKLVYN